MEEVVHDPDFGETVIEKPEPEVKPEVKPEPVTKTILVGGGHVKVHPLVHEAMGGHYGWQMSSVDHAILDRARKAGEELKDMHDPEAKVEFAEGEDGLTYDGLPVSVHAS